MELLTQDLYEKFITEQKDFMIFKHSSTCSISSTVCREVYQSVEELRIGNIYLVDVLDGSGLKHYIAQDTGIQHESPQIIVFVGGKAIAHASHGNITTSWIAEEAKKIS